MIRLTALLLMFFSITSHSQEIALTFDDAPTASGPLFSGVERTKRIIDALKENQVNEAAFFILTHNIDDGTKKRIKEYSDAGHILANHSHSHLWIHQVGTRAYVRDLRKADSILRLMPSYQKWYRYPYLDEGRTVPARDSIRAALKEMDLTNGYVTVDNYDWYLNSLLQAAKEQKKKINLEILKDIYIEHVYASIAFYDKLAMTHIGRSPKHVLLLHENDLAALFLDDLIAYIKEKGWKIISPRAAYQDPIATRMPDVLFNGQGRIAAIAREKGIPARELVQITEDEEFLDQLVKSRKAFE